MKRQNQRGMTLVELMVIVAIIGILSAMAIPVLFSKRDKVKAAARQIHQNITVTKMTAMKDGVKTYASIGESGSVEIFQFRNGSGSPKTVLLSVNQDYKVTVSPTELSYSSEGITQQNNTDILVTDGETKLYVSIGVVNLRVNTEPQYAKD
jgi:type IV pilus assembly protein PilA